MLTEMVEYGHKIEEKVKTMKSEIEKNAACAALGWLSATYSTDYKQVGPFWC